MKKLFLFFLFILLTGCQLKKKNKFILHHYNSKKNVLCTVAACGIECRQCVLAALYSLQKIKRIKHIDCACPKQQYEKALFECYIEKDKEKSLPISEIVQAFERENFILKSMEGEFCGLLDDKKMTFTPMLFDKSFAVTGSSECLVSLQNRENKKQVFLSGKLAFDENKFYLVQSP
ncbi:TPA: hypothetical protein DIC20_03700 [Candidatus Dependentiae bacterium]|nr:hypothetical protein [Candidatus Dependentiae bacterium]HCU00780.1 hypothetical protein [Candidatus Dependentiae bacterium]